MHTAARIAFLPPILLSLVVPALSACSYSSIDEAGNRHVVGFVALTIAAPDAAAPASGPVVAGSVVEVTTLGLAAGSSPQGGHLSLGYSREVSGLLRDDALVLGDPLALDRALTPRPAATAAQEPQP
ncbi:hypothetical protein [Azospirillum thermophilum]|uniref:Uncharacterized protein n=1 Tax=Azospirillum thermophilum TaxID=2202148 RepID=A0A2S2CSQ5_9PROT|nr:hypothetical protein [Azospirillum thermophilum]AWK87499.1 hypothetical protein DEW08_15875 [Azospirillum thermophilum]